MKVALVCGPCPPGACGVGDYTVCLARALNHRGIEAHVISSDKWSLVGAIKLSPFGKLKFDVVHIQYPTVGFGGALIPQLLSLSHRCVITIHEVSGAHILRKFALLPFSIRPERLVFPSEYERQFALKWVPWISRVSSIIPVPSNIRAFEGSSNRSRDEILYFGLIMPKKGLEAVLGLAGLIKSARLSFRIRIMGSCPPKHAAYFEELKSETSTLPIIWETGLGEQQVAKRLASSSIAYLPYPDGVSERRASFKAALLNGVTVITTRGQHTPASLEGLVTFCASPEEALVAIRFLSENAQQRASLSDKAYRYARQFTWDTIAQAHVAIYKDLLGAESRPERVTLMSPESDTQLDSKSVSTKRSAITL